MLTCLFACFGHLPWLNSNFQYSKFTVDHSYVHPYIYHAF